MMMKVLICESKSTREKHLAFQDCWLICPRSSVCDFQALRYSYVDDL